MGLYATLENASVTCPKCGAPCTDNWQFNFGAVSDLPCYRIGDTVRWTGGQWFGTPSMSLVHALAYSLGQPACRGCGTPDIVAELRVRDGVLEALCNARATASVAEILYEGEARVPRYSDELYCVVQSKRL